LEWALQPPDLGPVVCILVLDGEPDDMMRVTELLQSRDAEKVFVTILAYSHMKELQKLQDAVPNIAVLPRFESAARRKDQKFGKEYSYGTHIARMILAAMDEKYRME
jgi:hypothetical protein